MRLVLFIAATVAAVACAPSSNQAPLALTQPCNGHACRVAFVNHTATPVNVVYKDSTGRSENVGRAPGASTLEMRVQFVHSAGIRVFAIDPDKHIFAADYTFPLSGPMEIHYPDDFEAVDDTVMPRRSPG